MFIEIGDEEEKWEKKVTFYDPSSAPFWWKGRDLIGGNKRF